MHIDCLRARILWLHSTLGSVLRAVLCLSLNSGFKLVLLVVVKSHPKPNANYVCQMIYRDLFWTPCAKHNLCQIRTSPRTRRISRRKKAVVVVSVCNYSTAKAHPCMYSILYIICMEYMYHGNMFGIRMPSTNRKVTRVLKEWKFVVVKIRKLYWGCTQYSVKYSDPYSYSYYGCHTM